MLGNLATVRTRVLAVILEGQEQAAVDTLNSLAAIARADRARIRLAYFHPMPQPIRDTADRIVVDGDRVMAHIAGRIADTFSAAARRFDVEMETVVRFGRPHDEVIAEMEVFRPGFVACFSPQPAGPLDRLRQWALRRRIGRERSAQLVVVQAPVWDQAARTGRQPTMAFSPKAKISV